MASEALVVPVTDGGMVAGAATKFTAPSPFAPLVMTGVGGELIDAFTVTIGFAYCDGGMN